MLALYAAISKLKRLFLPPIFAEMFKLCQFSSFINQFQPESNMAILAFVMGKISKYFYYEVSLCSYFRPYLEVILHNSLIKLAISKLLTIKILYMYL